VGTQTGATGKGTTGVGTGSTVKAINTATWAAALLEKLKAPVTATNIANIQRWIGVESAGNQAGFLRDNNPLNLNTYTSAHGSLPNGTIVQEFGIYVQTFPSVEGGITATANQISQSPALLAALKNSAPATMFGGALSQSAWKSGSYANSSSFAKLKPFSGTSAVGGQGLTFSPSKGVTAVKNAGKTVATVITAPISTIDGLIKDITNPTTLKNVGIFVAGLALMGTGLLIFFAQTKTAKTVEGAAAKAA
jgi:hypothetical protein